MSSGKFEQAFSEIVNFLAIGPRLQKPLNFLCQQLTLPRTTLVRMARAMGLIVPRTGTSVAGSWFLFLVDAKIPATNHRAEQASRTPVVNRKVRRGNRTEAGGKAQAITSSVLQTCRKKSIDVFQFLGNAFRGLIGTLFSQSANTAQ